MHTIKNVILDLGGVLYAINYGIARNELQKLSREPGREIIFSREQQEKIFDLYDKGQISSAEFCQGLREMHELDATDFEITRAWNAMLLHVIPESLEIVRKLSGKVPLVLLSNTNELHIKHIEAEAEELFSLFDKVYYSYEMKMRKPDREIYEQVLQEMNFRPEETIFADDAPANVEGAIAAGIAGYRVDQDHPLRNILPLVFDGRS